MGLYEEYTEDEIRAIEQEAEEQRQAFVDSCALVGVEVDE